MLSIRLRRSGKAGDPFWIEPDVLHAVGHPFQDGTFVNLSGLDPSHAKNLFAGHTVYSMVLEVPDGELLAGGFRPAYWCQTEDCEEQAAFNQLKALNLLIPHAA